MGAELFCKEVNNNTINNCSICHLPRSKKKAAAERKDSCSIFEDENADELNDSIIFEDTAETNDSRLNFEDENADEPKDGIIFQDEDAKGGVKESDMDENEEEVKECACDSDRYSTDDNDEWSDDWSDGDGTILTSSHAVDVDFEALFGPVCTDVSDLLPPSNARRCSSPLSHLDAIDSDDNFDCDEDAFRITDNAHLLGGVASTARDGRKQKIQEMGPHEKVEPHVATKVTIKTTPTEVREDVLEHAEDLCDYRFSIVKFMIADRERFNRQLNRCKAGVEWCLNAAHREKKFHQLHANDSNSS